MTIHLIKLAVGASDLEDLRVFQEAHAVPYLGGRAVPVWTRHKPKREGELLEGGSLYRVIKNRIQCRQEILGFEKAEDKDHGTFCLIMVSTEIMRTVAVPFRPFQGWRYLDPAKAPADSGVYDPAEAPPSPAMEKELKALGLI